MYNNIISFLDFTSGVLWSCLRVDRRSGGRGAGGLPHPRGTQRECMEETLVVSPAHHRRTGRGLSLLAATQDSRPRLLLV